MTTATIEPEAQSAEKPGELSLFRQQDKIIDGLLEQSKGLTIAGINDRKGLEAVHSQRMLLVKARTSLDKTRLAMNADARKHIERINAEAKRLTARIEPEEARLEKLEADVEAEKERIKQAAAEAHKAKVKARFDALRAAGDYREATA